MIFFDMRTIVFSNVITDIVCMVVIVLLWQQSRKRLAGTDFLVFDFALQTTALFLIILRGNIPAWMSFVLANTLVMAGALLGYMGLTRFVGKKSFQIHNYILLTAFAFVHAYFTFVQPDQAARNLNISVGLLIICFQCAWLLLRGVEPGKRQLTLGVGIVFGLYCLLSMVRIVEFFTGVHLESDYLQSGIFEKLVLVSNQMLFILLTYSLVLMFNKRLLVDIKMGEEKFSKAFHSSPYAVTITRMSDGQIIEVNESFFNITGYQWADIIGKTTIGMQLWDRAEDRAFVIGELASKGKVSQREFQFRKKSGERITGLFSAEIITVNNEKCVLSSINDITERKQTEEELRESENKYKSLIDNFQDIIFNIDLEGKITFASQSTKEILGYESAEAINMNILNFIQEEDRQKAIESLQKGMKGEKVKRFQIQVITKSGGRLFFECSFSRVYKDGAVVGAQAIARDITERAEMEEALKESERQYRNLFENSLEGIFQTTPEGKLISTNMAFAKMFGYESTDEIIRTVRDIGSQLYVNSEEREKAVNILRETGYLKEFECKMCRNDGTTFWAVINARFTETRDGQRYFEGFIIDINDRKRAESQREAVLEEIRLLNVGLEQKVAERTNELSKSQLALLNLVEDMNQSAKIIDITNRTLEATNKELESFSYSVSHDLRAPLRSIDGFSQAMLEDYHEKLDDTGRNYLKKIRKATQNMGMLIDDMLKLSRVILAEFRQESVDVSKMVQDILRTVRQNDPARNVKVSVQKGIIIGGDRHMLEIALTNLIENAWKFTNKTENARIEFGKLLKDGKPVMFIRDNGAGFDMSYVNKLFGAFQRLHIKAEFAGTGVGLATVKRIINRHGGEVWAEGEVGKGASFYFTLGE